MTQKTFKAIGLMSGTSIDGIDAAIITTDGYKLLSKGASQTFPYTETFRNKIKNLIKGQGNKDAVAVELTKLHAEAVKTLLDSSGEDKNSIDLIGFHGHTISHRPYEGVTVQIGDGKLLSELTGISVVNDFRSNDVKQGGQGAPLVPIYHQALMAGEQLPIVVVNIGGVANVTWIGEDGGDLLAFDTGPGNALLDDWMKNETGKNYDAGGAVSKSGIIDEELLAYFIEHPYFSKQPPKSLDRNSFKGIPEGYNINTANGAATLVAFTAEAIALAAKFFPQPVNKWVIAGGGRHNIAIMDYLGACLYEPVVNIDEFGLNGDMIEAEAFAFLAVRTKLGLPISFPGTTGVKGPTTGGVLCDKNEV